MVENTCKKGHLVVGKTIAVGTNSKTGKKQAKKRIWCNTRGAYASEFRRRMRARQLLVSSGRCIDGFARGLQT